jgi:hypothetical protein
VGNCHGARRIEVQMVVDSGSRLGSGGRGFVWERGSGKSLPVRGTLEEKRLYLVRGLAFFFFFFSFLFSITFVSTPRPHHCDVFQPPCPNNPNFLSGILPKGNLQVLMFPKNVYVLIGPTITLLVATNTKHLLPASSPFGLHAS